MLAFRIYAGLSEHAGVRRVLSDGDDAALLRDYKEETTLQLRCKQNETRTCALAEAF